MKNLFLLLILSLFLEASTTNKINTNQKSLANATKEEREVGKKLDDIAKDIRRQLGVQKKLDDESKVLEVQVANLDNSTKNAQKELEVLNKRNELLTAQKGDLEQKMTKIITEQFAFDIAKDRNYQESQDGIIANEVLKQIDQLMKKNIKELNEQYTTVNISIQATKKSIDELNSSLRDLRQKQNSLAKLKEQQKQSLNALNRQNDEYKKRLLRINDEKKELQSMLEQLKIIRLAEEEKKEKERAEQEAKRATAQTKPSDAQQIQVRQIGSSYQNSRVKKYTGQKTIAPLDDYEVKQEFGNYVDPIYNIKIFNESVVLRSKKASAQVKNVLAGKVVYARSTSMLDHVVIVENSDGMHTIYAQMTQIAPTVKVGTKVRQGFVIGRVDRDLTFEVTQKNYHINPLEMIARK